MIRNDVVGKKAVWKLATIKKQKAAMRTQTFQTVAGFCRCFLFNACEQEVEAVVDLNILKSVMLSRT